MEKTLVIALHGFLGLPSDWNAWWQKYGPPHAEFLPIPLWTHPTLNSSLSLNHWVDAFIAEVEHHRGRGYSVEVWGYSMGGRLALSAITTAPHLFRRAVILSANPGIEDDFERSERLQKDLVWSNKFLTMDWNLVMNEWNDQPLFQLKDNAGNILSPPSRSEECFDRTRLSQALDHWSVARQPNLWPFISTLALPIAWHVGSHDSKYVSMAQKLKQLNSHLCLNIHDHSGHRLLESVTTVS